MTSNITVEDAPVSLYTDLYQRLLVKSNKMICGLSRIQLHARVAFSLRKLLRQA